MNATKHDARDPRGAQARRRPLRLRPVEGPPRAARRASPGRARGVMGTSHRQKPVKAARRARPRRACASCSRCPTATRSRSATAARPPSGTPRPVGLVRERSLHLAFGEFSAKFATVTEGAPFLERPDRRCRPSPATRPTPAADAGRRRRRLGPQRDVHRRDGRRSAAPRRGDALVLIDATSGAGGLPRRRRAGRRLLLRPAEVLRRRRRPVARAAEPRRAGADRGARRAPDRWIPEFLSLTTALDNSRKDQTYNTPAVATLLLLADQVDWMLDARRPGLVRARGRRVVVGALYGWAERAGFATPFVADPAKRSLVVGTIDFDDAVDAAAVAATLRANGIVDVEPYRKLGRNQLRVGMFPAIEPADVEALTACIDCVVERQRMTRRPGRREDRRLRRRRCCASTSTSTSASTGDGELDAHRRLRRHPDPLGDEDDRRPDRAGRPPEGRSAAPAWASTTSTSRPRPSAGIVVANAPAVQRRHRRRAHDGAAARARPQRPPGARGADRGPLGALEVLRRRAARTRRSASSASGASASSSPSAPAASACASSPSTRSWAPSATASWASRRPRPPTTVYARGRLPHDPPAQDPRDRGLARRRGASRRCATACASSTSPAAR